LGADLNGAAPMIAFLVWCCGYEFSPQFTDPRTEYEKPAIAGWSYD